MADAFVERIKNQNQTARTNAAAAICIEQLSTVLQLPESDCRASLRDCAVFDWYDDRPHVRGGYMYPVVGMKLQHLRDLAAREGRVLFAGEATNTNASCTVQAAMETGIRAAREIMTELL